MSHAAHGTGDFVPGSVRIVDYSSNSGNVLIRGSAAFGATSFVMADLLAAIQADPSFGSLPAAIRKNLTGSAPPVVDFCLIGFGSQNRKDHGIVQQEAAYFDPQAPALPGEPTGPSTYPWYVESTAAPSAGTMVFWPVQSFGEYPCAQGGSWLGPPYPDLSILPAVSGQGGYDFAALVPAMKAALTNDTSALPSGSNGSYTGGSIQSAIVYVHCDSGVNRTGAAVVSYLMQYGSNLPALGLPSQPAGSPYTLKRAQKAANLAPPVNDTTPPGGNDIQVAMGYANYLASPGPNKTASGPLVAAAVPCLCPSCSGNPACS